MKDLWISGSLAVLLLPACQGKAPDPRKDDTPTSGIVKVLADVDLRPLVEAQREVFEGLYHKAHLEVIYLTEQELLARMASDSIRCSFTCALPGGTQDSLLNARTVKARPVPICIDGIAVVVHPSSAFASISVERLRDLLTPGSSDPLVPLFAGSGSGVARSLVDTLDLQGLRAQALPDVDAVLDRVSKDPATVGLIPFNSISDLDDPMMQARREKVRLLSVSATEDAPAVLPSQSTLADRQYPLGRIVHVVLTEGRSGLGTGFVSFVANHKGQRIFLKRGVAPIKVPTRDVEIVHQ